MKNLVPICAIVVSSSVVSIASGCTDDSDPDLDASLEPDAGGDGGPAPDAAEPDADVPDASNSDWCDRCTLAAHTSELTTEDTVDCGAWDAPPRPWASADASVREDLDAGSSEDAGLDGGDASDGGGDPVVTCVADALKDGTPFVVVVRDTGIDSIIKTGWVQTSDGSLFAYAYDSGACLGASCSDECGPRVVRSQCMADAMVDVTSDTLLECDALMESRTLCQPPGRTEE